MEWWSLSSLLQLIVGLGLLHVWLVRGRSATLMIGAIAAHFKVGDPPLKSLPAALMLVMSAGIVALRL